MELIPVEKNSPFLEVSYVLDGSTYVISLDWNMRAGWFLGLKDSDGEVIMAPRRTEVGVDLLVTIQGDARTPPGILMAVPLNLDDSAPVGYDDWVANTSDQDPQGRVALTYMTAEELAET